MLTPARRTIWIYIGVHKTATTSIQAALAQSRDVLRTYGIFVPKAGTTGPNSGHHAIGWAARGRLALSRGVRRPPRTRQGTERRSRACGGDLCRGPRISGRAEQVVAADRGRIAAGGLEPRYIVYLRRQSDYATSLWNELAKHGLSVGYARFMMEILLHGKFVMNGDWVFYFDFARFLARWRATTTGAIHARAYERGWPAPDLIRDFLLLVGVDAPAAAAIAERSPALNVGSPRQPGLVRTLRRRSAHSPFRVLQHPPSAFLERRFEFPLRRCP